MKAVDPIRGASCHCLALLEDLVALAKTGQLVSIAAAYETADAQSNFQIAKEKWSSWIVMVGELERAKASALRHLEDARQ